MSHLGTLFMSEVRKPLEQMQRNSIGYIDGESLNAIYYKIDGRIFRISIEEVDDMGRPVEKTNWLDLSED